AAEGVLDPFGGGQAGALGRRGGLPIAATEADRRRELARDEVELLARVGGASAVVEAFGLLELLPQLLDAALVRGLGGRIEDRSGIAEAGDRKAVGGELCGAEPIGRRARPGRLGDQLPRVEMLPRMTQQEPDVLEPLRVADSADGAVVGERPILALAAEHV